MHGTPLQEPTGLAQKRARHGAPPRREIPLIVAVDRIHCKKLYRKLTLECNGKNGNISSHLKIIKNDIVNYTVESTVNLPQPNYLSCYRK